MHSLQLLIALANVKAGLGHLMVCTSENEKTPTAVRCALWIEDGELVGDFEVGLMKPNGHFEPKSGGSL